MRVVAAGLLLELALFIPACSRVFKRLAYRANPAAFLLPL